MTKTMILIGGLLLLVGMRAWFQLQFYRGYFRQKQTNLGKNPDEVLRSEFGKLWRLVR